MKIGRLLKQRAKKKYSAGPLMLELEPRVLLSADLPGGLAGDEALHDSVLPTTEPAVLANNEGMSPMDVAASATQTLRLVVPVENRGTSTTDAAVTQTHELVIVNLSTPDYEIIVDDLIADRGDGRQFEVVILDTDRGGIEQLSELLGERADLDAVHIISHGNDGSISLGNELLNLDALIANATTIQGWGDAFTAEGDLLIYGCNLAAGADGRAFIDVLGRLTGTDIAASTDLTGAAALGGDWDLEYRQDVIEINVALSTDAQREWAGVLVAPVVTVDSLTTNDTSPQLTGTVDDVGATIEVTVDGNLYAAVNNADGTWTLADNSIAPALTEGTYDVAVTADNGEIGTDSSTDELVIDLTGPSAPVVNLQITNDNTPIITGTYDSADSAGLSVAVNGVTYVLGTDTELTTSVNNWTLNLSAIAPLADATYQLTAIATDAAGNSTTDASSNELTIDTTGPAAPVVNPLTTNDTTPILTGTYDSAGSAGLSVAVNGTTYVLGTDAELTNAGDDWTLDLSAITPLADGTYEMTAIATDLLSNPTTDASSNELVIDSTPPVVTIDTLTTNDTTPQLTGTVDDVGATIEVTVDGNLYAATNNGDGTWTLADNTISPALADGTYDVVVTADNGVIGTDSTSNELVIDSTSPVVTVDALLTNNTTPQLTGTVDDTTAAISVTVDGNAYAATNNGDGTWTLANNTITPALANGTYDVAVTATDVAGNPPGTDATTNELVIDTTAPSAPVVNPLTTTDTTPILTGTYDSSDSPGLSVAVNGTTYVLGTDAELTNAGDAWTLNLSGIGALGDGTYNVTAIATDAAGNSATDASSNELVIDTTGPTVTVNPLTTNDNTPIVTGTFDEADSASLSVAVNGVTYVLGSDSELTNAGDAWTLNLSAIAPLADGTYEVTAIATDAVGNATTDSSSNELVIDTTSPVVTVDGNVYAATNNGNGTWTLANNTITPALAEGTYDVVVTATDVAGNPPGTDATTNELVIDTTAPSAPVVNPLTTTDTTPILTGTFDSADSPGLSVAVNGVTYVLGSDAELTNAGDDWTLNLSAIAPLADGTYEVTAIATDAAGNPTTDASSNELFIDATGPAVTVNPLRTMDTTPILTGTFDEADSPGGLSVTVNGVTYVLGTDAELTNVGDDWTLDLSAIAPLAEGVYPVTATAIDALGNPGTDASTNELDIDLTPPVVTVDSLTTNDTSPQLTGTVDDTTASISVTVDGNVYAATNNGDGTWTLADNSIAPALAEGTYDVAVTATDTIGNPPGTDATTNELVIDLTGPSAPVVDPLTTTDTTPILTGTFDSAGSAGLSVAVNGVTYVLGTDAELTNVVDAWTLDLSATTPLAGGTYEVTAIATDAVGNPTTDATSNELVIDANNPPVNSVPGGQTMGKDTTLVFSSGNGNLISVSDAEGGPVRVTVRVDNGSLTLSQITGLTFVTGDGTDDATMTFTGTLAAVNAALNGMGYTPDPGWTGTPTLTVTTDDPALDQDANITTKYTFDVGGTDVIGSNDSTLNNGAAIITDAERGNVLNVDGSNDYAAVPAAVTSGLSQFSFSFWVKTTESGTAGNFYDRPTLLGNRTGAAGSGDFAIYTNDGFIGIWSGLDGGGANTNDLSTTQINDDLWHQITVSNDGVTAELYVDGISVATINTGTGVGMDPVGVNIGSINQNGTAQQYHQGLFDEVRFFDRPLTLQEISDLLIQTDTDTVAITVGDVVVPTVNFLITNDNTPIVTGTYDSTDNSGLSVAVNGVTYVFGTDAELTTSMDNWTLNLSAIAPLTDGSYNVIAIALDGGGTPYGDITGNELVIDTTGPPAPVVNPLTTNDTTPIVTGTYTAGGSFGLSVAVDGVTYVLGTDAELTTSGNDWTLDLSAIAPLADGTYEVTAIATDLLGNPSPDASSNELVIDTISPVVTVDTLVTDDTTPQLTGTIDDTTATISVTVDGNVYAATNNGDGTWTLADDTITPALAEGFYDVAVTATDVAGNPPGSDATTNELEVDVTGALVTIDPLTTNDGTPQLTGTVNDPTATIDVTVDGNTYAATNNGDGTWTLADNTITPALADGTYDVIVTSDNGEIRTDNTIDELVIDTTSPVITVDALTTNDTSPQLTGTVDDTTAAISVTVDGNVYAATNNGDGTWTLADNSIAPPLTEGTYDVAVTATDVAGNPPGTDASNNELVIDLTAPAAPVVNPLSTNDTTPILTGTYDSADSAGLSVAVNGVTYVLGTDAELTSSVDDWTLDLSAIAPLAEATYEVTAIATDAAGNPTTDATSNELVIDLTGPTVTVTPLTTNDPTPMVTGTYDSADSVGLSVAVNGVTYVLGTDAELSTSGDDWTLDLSAITPLAEATYEVTAIATDAAGNPTTDSSSNELVIDLTAPSVPVVNALTTNDQTPILTGTYDSADSAGLSVAVNGVTYVLGTDVELTTSVDDWTLDLSAITPLAENIYEVTAIATDAAGNPATDASSNELVIDLTAPVVTVDPLTTTDLTPQLTGTVDDTTASISVTVDGNVYAATNNGDGTWTLADNSIAPALTVGTYEVAVTATDVAGNPGSDATSNELVITPNNPPTAADNTVATAMSTDYTFIVADFLFSDVDGDSLDKIQITKLESVGALQLNGFDVTVDQEIDVADITAGNLKFVPVPGQSGTGYDSFEFRVHDGVEYSAPVGMTTHINATFDADAEGFAYADDTFGTTNPSWADGTYDAGGGFAGGGLRVDLAGGATGGPTSGGWSDTFNLAQAETVTVSLQYRLFVANPYEAGEYGEIILDIDGTRYGTDLNNSLAHIAGGGDTGWLYAEFDIALGAGAHTLTVGAYNNNATASDEFIEAYFDDINLTTPGADYTMTVDVAAAPSSPSMR